METAFPKKSFIPVRAIFSVLVHANMDESPITLMLSGHTNRALHYAPTIATYGFGKVVVRTLD